MNFKLTQVLFFVHLVTKVILKPDPKKVNAIANMPAPQNKTQLQLFVGLCNYLSCYVHHLTDVLSPLRALTVKSIEFKWEWLHDESFKKVKQAIANSCTLQYFNSEDLINIQVDTSSFGVGAALMQQGRVVSYHSRALTPTQQRYSNIEHECCRLVNGIEHFHHYVFGRNFMVHTHHQPLVQLMTKPLCEISPRLQRLLLKVIQYNFTTLYVKHDGMPVADCLSWNVQVESALENETINVTVAAISMFQEGKINQIKCETSKDLTLVKLAKVVQTGWPDQ